MPTRGQLWYLTQGIGSDARLTYINSDGTNSTVQADNSPTLDLGTSFPEDVVLDTAAGLYFVLAGDGAGTNAQILVGHIGSATPPVAVETYDPSGEAAYAMHLDATNNKLYVSFIDFNNFGDTTQGIKVYDYDPATGTLSNEQFLFTQATAGVDPSAGDGFGLFIPRDFDFDFQRGYVYFAQHTLGDFTESNMVWRLDLNNPSAPAVPLAPQAQFPLDGDGSDFTTLNGIIVDVEVDIDSDRIFFTTHAENPEDAVGEDAIWMVANASTADGSLPAVQVTLVGVNLADFYPGDIAYDSIANMLYVESEHTQNGADPDDDVILVFQLDALGTTATLVDTITPGFNDNANIGGMQFNSLPVLADVNGTPAAAAEQGAAIALLTGEPTITDVDGGHLASATVQITGGTFTSNETSANDDDLGIGAGMQQSGLIAGTNITVTWVQATSTLTLTGYDTLANYEAALAAVRYQASGDNPTNYGANPSRTITWTVSDGAIGIPAGEQNSQTSTLNIAAANDGPTNTVPGAQATNEDTALAISGVQVADVDANPATTDITVTLSVLHGGVTLRTDVAGGITAGDVAGNGTGSATITATINQINATLAAVNGLVYAPAADYYGPDTLQVVTNDGGNTGSGGPLSDSDSISIAISATADIAGDAAMTNEDTAVNVLVLANDSFEGTPAITGFSQGANGTVALNNNGTPGDTTDDYLVYTPNADYNGPDSFTYTVTSGGATETATVNVSTSAVADIADDNVMVAEDSGANALNLLANDSFENAGRSITAVTQGVNGGTVAIDNNGTPGNTADDFVTYTPAGNYSGPDSFTYTVTSGGVTETATVNVTVTGGNDDPVNTTGGPVATSEDASVAVTGLAVSDIDSAALSVTLSVGRGTLAINTGVPGGVTAGQVTGNGSGSVTITGSQAQINTTLAAASGVTYTPTANVNGPDTLTMATSDGSGGSDTDMVSISVTAVNDAPTVAGDGTEDAAPIVQDMPSPVGQSVASLFGGQYSDATDQVAGGSSADAFAGVAVTANGSGASGQWQYFNGAIWVNIGPASDGAAVLLSAGTSIRFNPAPGFFGAAPTLTTHLVDASGGALTSGTIVNASVTGGTTRYSTGTVVLSETVIAGNTPPTGVTGTLAVTEVAVNGTTVGTVVATDPDSATFTYSLVNDAGGRFNISSGGVVTVENGLLLDYEQASSHVIRVRVDDNEGGISEFNMNVTVNDRHGELVIGDNANHTYFGGAETDILLGGLGSDTIRGQGGADVISGATVLPDAADAGDFLYGGTGNDIIDGNGGNDVIAGGADSDLIFGGTGSDTIYGGDSASDLTETGNDVISGDAGNDFLYGNGGSDALFGGTENDELYGGAGSDELSGDAGVDRLDGGAGADELTGGSGFDVFVFKKGQANGDVIMDFDGNGSSAGDTIRLEGYAAGTTFTKVSGDLWRINDHGFIEFVTIHADGNVHSTDYGFFP